MHKLINPLPVNIASHIRELLLHNQKVVIPGFGTFLIQRRPAELNKTTHVLTPPSKEIQFDSRQQDDDGQLSGYLAQKLKLNKTEAIAAIEHFLKMTGEQLTAREPVVLEGLGIFTREKSGEIAYKPDAELLKRANLFELPKIGMPVINPVASPVKPPDAPPVLRTAVIEKPIVRQVTIDSRKTKRWIPAALVALVIVLSALGYFTGIFKNTRSANQSTYLSADTNEDPERLVFGSREAADTNQHKPDTFREKISHELDERTVRENALRYEEPRPKPLPDAKVAGSEPVKTTLSKPFHIIAGAFLVPNNAERLKLQLEGKGFSPVLLPKRGDYYMVSLDSFDSAGQAAAAIKQLRGKLDQALWVKKIK